MVAEREARRLSFGSVATDYDRYRPPPPPQALDWLIPPGAQAILDLAAGTGVVTRELIGRAARVIASSPSVSSEYWKNGDMSGRVVASSAPRRAVRSSSDEAR